MWIKEPIMPLGVSHHETLNFVFKNENIYVMDNHLAASWCWLDIIDITQKYNLFHIDRHYDLLDFPNTIKTQILDAGIEVNSLTLDQYVDLRQPMRNGESAALFRWDNYIGNLNLIYPQLFDLKYFATHNEGTVPEGFIDYECEIYDLLTNVDYWMKKNENKWILNLDIDYFFATSDDGKYQMLTDEYIVKLCESINVAKDKIAVITICLSPECCGGWDVSIEKAKLVCKHLGFEFPLEL